MLEDLYAGALADASIRSKSISTAKLEALVAEAKPTKGIIKLKDSQNVSIIAEIKRASPSKGPLASITDAAALAQEYEQAGAAMISVLTEQRKFLGSLEDLQRVTETVSCPVLRKDFIASRYQILEARANGADAVLLIVAGLEIQKLNDLFSFASDLGMACLVETHSEEEFLTAVDLGAVFIGVNARDLTTFETDRDLFGKIASKSPAGVVLVAESAVRGLSDVEAYAKQGADAVLIGEALVTGDHRELVARFSQVAKNRI